MNTLEVKNILLNKLRKKYPKLEFKFKDNIYFKYYLLYKDKKKYMKSDTEEFEDELNNICKSIIHNEDLFDLVIVYDYLGEIDNIKNIS